MRSECYRGVSESQTLRQGVPEEPPCDRIYSTARLIKELHIWTPDKGQCHAKLSLIPATQLLAHHILVILELHHLDEVLHGFPEVLARQTFHLREYQQMISHSNRLVEGVKLRANSHVLEDIHDSFVDLNTLHQYPSLRLREVRCQYIERCAEQIRFEKKKIK